MRCATASCAPRGHHRVGTLSPTARALPALSDHPARVRERRSRAFSSATRCDPFSRAAPTSAAYSLSSSHIPAPRPQAHAATHTPEHQSHTTAHVVCAGECFRGGGCWRLLRRMWRAASWQDAQACSTPVRAARCSRRRSARSPFASHRSRSQSPMPRVAPLPPAFFRFGAWCFETLVAASARVRREVGWSCTLDPVPQILACAAGPSQPSCPAHPVSWLEVDRSLPDPP